MTSTPSVHIISIGDARYVERLQNIFCATSSSYFLSDQLIAPLAERFRQGAYVGEGLGRYIHESLPSLFEAITRADTGLGVKPPVVCMSW